MSLLHDRVDNKLQLQDRLLSLAISVCRLAEALPATRTGDHVARQLIRSGTSPAANYAEACGAESRPDFIHKLSVCVKELRETLVWLELLQRIRLGPRVQVQEVMDETDQLIAIFVRSIRTTKERRRPDSER